MGHAGTVRRCLSSFIAPARKRMARRGGGAVRERLPAFDCRAAFFAPKDLLVSAVQKVSMMFPSFHAGGNDPFELFRAAKTTKSQLHSLCIVRFPKNTQI